MNIKKVEKIIIQIDGDEAYELGCILKRDIENTIKTHINTLQQSDHAQRVSVFNEQNKETVNLMKQFYAVSPYNFGLDYEQTLLEMIKKD